MADKRIEPENVNVSLPYNATMQVCESIMDILGRSHEMNTSELFKKVLAKNVPEKSYSLSLCKFLNLVESNGSTVKLTKLGFKYVNSTQKKELIAHNLPDKYLTILAWIKSNNGTMTIEDIRNAIIDNWGKPPKERVFKSMLRAFGNYCSHIGVLKYVKGTAGRVELTQLGFTVLSIPKQESGTTPIIMARPQRDTTSGGALIVPMNESQNMIEGNYPIRIFVKDKKPLDWDIIEEGDWLHVDSYIAAIKSQWKKNHMQKPDGTSGTTDENSGE